jgi:hypothetical protein
MAKPYADVGLEGVRCLHVAAKLAGEEKQQQDMGRQGGEGAANMGRHHWIHRTMVPSPDILDPSLFVIVTPTI